MSPQVRRWDVETGIATDTLNSGNAVYAVATAPRDSNGVVAFGGAERALRLWDSRARGTENLVHRGSTFIRMTRIYMALPDAMIAAPMLLIVSTASVPICSVFA